MNEQQWQDIEDYNLGLQGVQNGSAHNTMGLQDRPKSSAPNYINTPRRKTTKATPNKVNKVKKGKKEGSALELIFFIVGAIAVCVYMSGEGVEELVAYLVGGAAAGMLCAWLHKVIIGIAVFLAVMYVVGVNV